MSKAGAPSLDPGDPGSDPFLKKRFKEIIGLTTLLSLGILLILLWTRGPLQGLERRFQLWAQKRVIAKLVAELQPQFPFLIEALEIEDPWAELKQGKIAEVRMILKWPKTAEPGFRLRARGPLQIHEEGHDSAATWSFHYNPLLTVESVAADGSSGPPASPLHLSLFLQMSATFKKILAFEIRTAHGPFKWPEFGVDLEKAQLHSAWNLPGTRTAEVADLEFSAGKISWTRPGSLDHVVHLEKVDFETHTPLSIQPFAFGTEVTASLKSKTLEILWGESYIDFPIHDFPLTSKFKFDSSYAVTSADLIFPNLHLSALKGPSNRTQLKWKSQSLALAKIQAEFNAFLPKSLAQLEIKQGFMKTQGQASLSADFKSLHSATGSVAGEKISLLFRDASSEIRNASMLLPFTYVNSAISVPEGSLEIPEAYFKHFKGKLGHTRFSYLPVEQPTGAAHVLESFDALPVQIQGLPFTAGKFKGTFGTNYEVDVPLHSDGLSLEKIGLGFCKKTRTPPATLQFKFEPLSFSNGAIEPDGKLKVKLFGGEITVDDIGFYDLGTEVPETDFNSYWNGIQIAQLGQWLGFGEMKGRIEGYAHDVVFQAWLPTRYDFKFQIIPDRYPKIVFSPDAMKNVVRLFGGEDIDHLPGVANWLAFGWPSRLFGGYDVDYFGLTAFSSEGSILLETLDPPEVLARERKHFILYGSRFRIPLNSPRYPLVVDATAMSNFARHMFKQFDAIAQAKEKTSEAETVCLPPGLTPP